MWPAVASIESNEQSARIRKPEALFKLSLVRVAMAEDHPPPKIAPGPKLPKPAVPHVYVTKGLGFGLKKLPPNAS